eukprot:262976_1
MTTKKKTVKGIHKHHKKSELQEWKTKYPSHYLLREELLLLDSDEFKKIKKEARIWQVSDGGFWTDGQCEKKWCAHDKRGGVRHMLAKQVKCQGDESTLKWILYNDDIINASKNVIETCTNILQERKNAGTITRYDLMDKEEKIQKLNRENEVRAVHRIYDGDDDVDIYGSDKELEITFGDGVRVTFVEMLNTDLILNLLKLVKNKYGTIKYAKIQHYFYLNQGPLNQQWRHDQVAVIGNGKLISHDNEHYHRLELILDTQKAILQILEMVNMYYIKKQFGVKLKYHEHGQNKYNIDSLCIIMDNVTG